MNPEKGHRLLLHKQKLLKQNNLQGTHYSLNNPTCNKQSFFTSFQFLIIYYDYEVEKWFIIILGYLIIYIILRFLNLYLCRFVFISNADTPQDYRMMCLGANCMSPSRIQHPISVVIANSPALLEAGRAG